MKRKGSPEDEEVGPTSGTQNIDLDQLIEERKQEKRKALKEKLQQKLRIIRERRTSGTNKKPFPVGAFERLKSNDIIGNVLEYLADPIDVTSTYYACRTFAEILEEQRMLTMLPNVLNVLKTRVDLAFETEGEEIGNIWYQNWNTFCLSARGVCKAWKEITNSHCDIARVHWIRTTDGHMNNPRVNVFSFDCEESVDELSSSLTSQGLKHSPVRDLYLSFGDHFSESYYWKLVEYFKAYGSSVRFLNIQYGSTDLFVSHAFEMIFDTLKYMENLKGLDVMFLIYTDNDEEDDDEQPERGEAFQDGLIDYPALSSLEHFSCSDWDTNEILVSQILRKCVNLKTLSLFYSESTENEMTEALAGLTLEQFQGVPTTITTNRFAWPLKHLEIKMQIVMHASVLFPAINHFQDTLEDLLIWKVVEMDDMNISLDLPHLKSIFLSSIRRGSMGFDQLLRLKSLEKITVRKVQSEDENSRVKVKRYLDSGNMDQSNVWQCFPNLIRLGLGKVCKWFHRPSSP